MAWQLINRVYTVGTIDGAQDITPGVAQTGFRDFTLLTNGNTTRVVVSQGAKWAKIAVTKVGAVLRPATYEDGSNGVGATVTFDEGSITVTSDLGGDDIVYNDADGNAINAQGVLNTFTPDTLATLKTTPLPSSGTSVAYLRGIVEGDNKGAYYIWDPDETASGDDFTYVVSGLSATGRWVRQTPIVGVPDLADDAAAYNESLYGVSDDLRHKDSNGVVKKIPRTENYVVAYYDTYAAFAAADSSQWSDGDVIGFRGITEKGDAPIHYGVWDASSTNTDSLGVLFIRPDDISGSNAGRCAFTEPGDISKLPDSDATPDVKSGRNFRGPDTAPAAITALDNAIDLETYRIFPGAQDLVFEHSVSLVCPGNTDYTLSTTDGYIEITYVNGIGYLSGGGVSSAILASTSNGEGASLIGVEDSAGNFTGENVETVLAEVASEISTLPNGAASSELTISSGAITLTGPHHTVDTEGDGATDDLTDITWWAGVKEGSVAYLSAENVSRVVTIKSNTGAGKIKTEGDADFSLDSSTKVAVIQWDGTQTQLLSADVSLDDKDASNALVTATDGTNSRSLLERVDGEKLTPYDFSDSPGFAEIESAVQAADAKGVFVPEGTFTGNDQITQSGALLSIEGMGIDATTLEYTSDGTVANYAALVTQDSSYGAILKNLSFDINPGGGATGLNLIKANGSGVVLDQVSIDGGVVVTGTARNWQMNLGLTTTDATVYEDLKIYRSKFSNMSYGTHLNANDQGSNRKNLVVALSEFDNFDSQIVLWNLPDAAASGRNALVFGNRLGANTSDAASPPSPGFSHKASFAGPDIKYIRFLANHNEGSGGQMVRAEEGVQGAIYAMNTGEFSGQDAITIIPNAADGTATVPHGFIVSNNALVHSGTLLNNAPAKGAGLQFTKGPGLEHVNQIEASTIHDNYVENFAEGIFTMRGAESTFMHHNILQNCAQGIYTGGPSLSHTDNMLVDCTEAIYFREGGALGPIHIRPTDGVGTVPTITVYDGPGGVVGWTYEVAGAKEDLIAAGPSMRLDVEVLPIGDMMDGIVTIVVVLDSSNYSFEKGHVFWDGTQFLFTRHQRKSAGSVQQLTNEPPGIKNSNFAISVLNNNAFSVDEMQIQIKFEGIHVWS